MSTTPRNEAPQKKLNGSAGHADENAENDDEIETRADRKSRISWREPRGIQKADTDKIRQDINELRERFSDANIPRSGDDLETQREAIVGDLHLLFVSETEIKYTNQKSNEMQLEDSGSVKVIVGYKTFEIHKNVLQQSSGYFREKLEADPAIASIELEPNIGIAGFTTVLDFLYDGSGTLGPRVAEIVFETAALLKMDWIKRAAADYMMRNIKPSNYRSVLDALENHDLKTRCSYVIRTVAMHLVEFSDDDNFLRTLQYDLLRKMLSDNYFIDGSEGFVTKVVLDWVQIDSARNERLPYLAKLLRLSLLEAEELLSLPESVRKIPGFEKEIDAAMEYVCNISAQYKFTGEKYVGRGYRNVIMLMSATESNNAKVVMYKDVETPDEPACLENLHPCGLDTMLVYTSQTVFGNFIYAAGGLDENYAITNRMFRFDSRIRDWQELASMTDNRMTFAMFASDKNLFAVGGESQGDSGKEVILNTAEMYHPDENTWKKLNPLPYNSADCAGVYHEDKLYISGGVDSKLQNRKVLDDFSTYNLKDGTWSKLDKLPTARFGHSMSFIGGEIYFIGGQVQEEPGTCNDCLAIDVYNVSSKMWRSADALPSGIGTIDKHVAVVDGKIAFLSGSRWRLYDSKTGEVTHGEYCGTDVRRVAYLSIAVPPSELD